jgi:hypothetical protein
MMALAEEAWLEALLAASRREREAWRRTAEAMLAADLELALEHEQSDGRWKEIEGHGAVWVSRHGDPASPSYCERIWL